MKWIFIDFCLRLSISKFTKKNDAIFNSLCQASQSIVTTEIRNFFQLSSRFPCCHVVFLHVHDMFFCGMTKVYSKFWIRVAIYFVYCLYSSCLHALSVLWYHNGVHNFCSHCHMLKRKLPSRHFSIHCGQYWFYLSRQLMYNHWNCWSFKLCKVTQKWLGNCAYIFV